MTLCNNHTQSSLCCSIHCSSVLSMAYSNDLDACSVHVESTLLTVCTKRPSCSQHVLCCSIHCSSVLSMAYSNDLDACSVHVESTLLTVCTKRPSVCTYYKLKNTTHCCKHCCWYQQGRRCSSRCRRRRPLPVSALWD
jgi:hypothetical protein